MDVTKLFKIALVERKTNQMELSNKIGVHRSGLSRTINRDNWTTDDIERIASALGYSVRLQLIDEKTGKILETD